MAINTLGGSTGSTKIYNVKNVAGDITVPSGVYTSDTSAEWGFSDSLGNDYVVGSGSTKLNLANGLSKINYGAAPTISRFSRGTASTKISPLGLMYDGAKYVAVDTMSKSVASTDGKTWALNADMAIPAYTASTPYVLGTYQGNNGPSNAVTVNFTQTLQQNDIVIVVMQAYNNPSVSTAGYTQHYWYAQTNWKSASYYKVMGATPDTSITLNNDSQYNNYYVIAIVRGAKIVAGVPSMELSPAPNGSYSPFGSYSGGYRWRPGALSSVKPNSLVLGFVAWNNEGGGGNYPNATQPGWTTLVNPNVNGYVGIFSQVTDISKPVHMSNLSSISSSGGYGSVAMYAFEPAVSPGEISAATYTGTEYLSYNVPTQKCGVSADLVSSWNYGSSSTTVSGTSHIPTIIAFATAGHSAISAITTPMPAGTAVGDTVLLHINNQYSGISNNSTAALINNGYTLLNSIGSTYTHSIWYKKLTSLDATVPIPGTNSNGSAVSVGITIVRNGGTPYSLYQPYTVFAASTADVESLGNIPKDTLIFGAVGGSTITNNITSFPAGYSWQQYFHWDASYDAQWWLCAKTTTVDGIENPGAFSFSTTVQCPPMYVAFPPSGFLSVTKIYKFGSQYFACNPDFATSTDKVTWTKKASAIGATVYSVAYGNGTYLITGNGGAVATSTDGTTWTVRATGSGSPIVASHFADGKFCVASSAGVLYYSADGANWTASNDTGAASIKSISYAGQNFVAWGDSGRVISLNTLTGVSTVVNDKPYGNENYAAAGTLNGSGRQFALTSAGNATYAGMTNENMTFTLVGEAIKLNG